MVMPINAAPYTNWLGIQDESTRAQTVEPLQVPTHLPLCPIYTQWGPTEATLVTPSSLTATYGADTFNQRSAYYNHQTLYAQRFLSQGNQIMVKRLIPADAGPKARLLLSLDLVAEPALPQYERNPDGTYTLDAEGNKIQITGVGATAAGYIGKWVLNQWMDGDAGTAEPFGAVAQRQGSIVSSDSTQSTLYPILELEATFIGDRGNNLGMRLLAPTTEDANNPLNSAQAARTKSFIYRLQFVSRLTSTASPQVIQTQGGEQSANFSFKKGAFDNNYDLDLDFQDVLATAFSQHGIPRNPPVYGPFENAKVYTDQLEMVLALIGAAEAPMGTLPVASMDASSDELYTVNPFTAVNYDNTPYYSLQLQGPASNGLIFTSNSTFYAKGGSDGTMSLTSYDSDVADWMTAFDLNDMAKYPFSFVWDSGFSLDTKTKAMVPLLGKRPDIALMFSTQSALDPQNNAAEDTSVARALAAAVGNYPESVVYGTAACRAAIIGSSGHLLNSNYSALVPASLQLAQTFAAYMGAGNGIWASNVPPDENPQNIITLFRDLNATYKTATARSQDWATGLVWVENFDMNTQYFPALASVYTNDTSILKAFMNVVIAIDLIKIAHQVRRELSGNSSLSDKQFVAKSNQRINELVKGRYAGRVQIVADTFYSTQDQANGYSWSCSITMYGNNMRTVGSDTIIARRMSDLNQ